MSFAVRFMVVLGETETTGTPFNYFQDARDARNRLFEERKEVLRAWIDQISNGVILRRSGAVLKRGAT